MSSEIGKAMRLYVEAVEKRDKETEELEAERVRLKEVARTSEAYGPEWNAYYRHITLMESRHIGLGTSVGIRRTQLLRLIEKELRRDGR